MDSAPDRSVSPAAPDPAAAEPRYRWVILGVGTGAQVVFAALSQGLPVVAPELRELFGLDLEQIGLTLAAVMIGQVFTQYAWGLAVDRVGDRAVLCVGLLGSGVALVAGTLTGRYLPFLLGLLVAGMIGASINVASSSAVATWFTARERGLALGIRQSALPLGGALGSVALPLIAVRAGVQAALVAVGVVLVVATAAVARWLRRSPAAAPRTARQCSRGRPGRRAWRLGAGTALLCIPQFGFIAFTVLYLHDEAGVPTSVAAVALLVAQLGGAAARILAGRWSDVAGGRVAPLRRLTLVIAGCSVVAGASIGAPALVCAIVLVVGGAFSLSWNGLAMAASVEDAPAGASGRALGFQNTLLACGAALAPPAFATVIAATSWRVAFLLLAPCALLSHHLLRPLLVRERDRGSVASRWAVDGLRPAP